MDRYKVSGELIVTVPYSYTVEAEGPVQAEKLATVRARIQANAGVLKPNLQEERRPENVSVRWIGEVDG